ncbi:uncharacterized protein MEPE_01067 [Melanopsichium pennsylvanicum]|uniref:Uncharacterized protein n=1 Tax=Melanopsichium pennsylvanicum TaxID=63383 RepID=A0AAJ4XIK9_9BASI|nr:uncharacterized protein MEPE_01067 [Melanopsichium pennsylvanicum]
MRRTVLTQRINFTRSTEFPGSTCICVRRICICKLNFEGANPCDSGLILLCTICGQIAHSDAGQRVGQRVRAEGGDCVGVCHQTQA